MEKGTTDLQYLAFRLPGCDDIDLRLREPVIGQIERTVKRLLNSSGIDRVEVLTLPGDAQQAYLLRALGQQSNKYTPQALTTTTIAEEYVAPRIGLEIVTVDKTPLNTAPAPTCRLLTSVRANRLKLPNHLLFAAVARLVTAQLPHLLEIAIETSKSGYLLSVRLATFDGRTRILTHDDRAKAITDPHPADISRDVNDESALSNFCLPIENGWTTHDDINQADGTPRLELEHATRRPDTADLAYELTDPTYEYDALLADTIVDPATYDRYRQVGVTPWLKIDEDDLSSIVGLAPIYADDASLWEATNQSPLVHTRQIIREANGTDHGTPTTPTSATSSPALPTRVKTAVQSEIGDLASVTARYFAAHGDRLTVCDADTIPATIRRHTPDGDTSIVVTATEDTVPGTIINAARVAAHSGETLTIVTPTRGVAKSITKTLSQPYQRPDGQYVELHLDPGRIWTPDPDDLRVAPRGRELRWEVTPAGNYRLLADDSLVAVLEPPSTFRTSLRRLRHTDTGVDILDADAETVVDTYPSLEDASADIQTVPAPAVPHRRSLLEMATVLSRRGSRLEPVRITAPWGGPGVILRHEDAVAAFLRSRTFQSDSAEIPLEEAYEEFAQWARNLTTESLPDRWAGTADLKRLGQAAKKCGTPHLQRKWVFPQGLPEPANTSEKYLHSNINSQ